MNRIQQLKTILLSQQQELETNENQAATIERKAYAAIQETLNSDLIQVITGVRRCGKSVLATELFPRGEFIYINFDDERFIDFSSKDLQDLLEAALSIQPAVKKFVFDEIQNVRGWELFANRLKRNHFRIVITGSNGKLLSKDLATHLTGRQISHEIFPFDFHEYLKVKDEPNFQVEKMSSTESVRLRNAFDDYFEAGGFPEVLKGAPAGPYLRELFHKVITRDIVERYSIRNSKALLELGVYLMNHVSSKFSYQKAAKLFGFKSVNTLKNYMQYLQDSYLVFEVLAYSNKHRERLTLPRKIYAIDNGMITSLRTRPTEDLGALLENFIFIELRRRGKEIYYYPGKDFEVDFVVREGQKISQLIQVCYDLSSKETLEREQRALVKAYQESGCKDLMIISYDQEDEITLKEGRIELKIHVVPVSKWVLN